MLQIYSKTFLFLHNKFKHILNDLISLFDYYSFKIFSLYELKFNIIIILFIDLIDSGIFVLIFNFQKCVVG